MWWSSCYLSYGLDCFGLEIRGKGSKHYDGRFGKLIIMVACIVEVTNKLLVNKPYKWLSNMAISDLYPLYCASTMAATAL